jgi:hypothetical protein
MMAIQKTSERIGIREAVKLTLPKEHGSWSLALEALALGMFVAPSVAGCALVWAAVAGFFMRRPLKLALSDKPDPRILLASVVVIALSIIVITSLLLAALFGSMKNLWPLMPAAIAGIGFAWFDSRNEVRQGAAELCGVIAFGMLPATFATLAGWSVTASAALAAVMLVRSVSTVLFVRTYLRRNKGDAINPTPAFLAAVAGQLLAGWLVLAHLVPWPAVVFAAILAIRTFWVLSGNLRLSAKRIGIAEATFGIVMVLSLAVSWKSY